MKLIKKKILSTIGLLLLCCLVLTPVVTSYAATKKDVTKTFSDTKDVKKLLTSQNTWVGYNYLYKANTCINKTVKLTNRTMLLISGIDLMKPTEKKIHTLSKAYFAKTPAISNLKKYKSREDFDKASEFAGRLADGSIVTMCGDWGISYPEMSLKKIIKTSSSTFQVTMQSNLVNPEKETTKEIGTTLFTIKKDKNVKYGYYITGIKLSSKN